MKFKTIALMMLALCTFSNQGYALENFNKAKIAAKKIYSGPLAKDIYCGCDFNSKGEMNWSKCGYNYRKQPIRGKRLEWEHVVPAMYLAQGMSCSLAGGRKECQKTDALFRSLEGDLHNLRPAVGELNADRSAKLYGLVLPHVKKYGRCEFYTNKDTAEPPNYSKGQVARITLYITEKYHIQFDQEYITLMRELNDKYPVTPSEIAINRMIQQVQGDSNYYIAPWTKK